MYTDLGNQGATNVIQIHRLGFAQARPNNSSMLINSINIRSPLVRRSTSATIKYSFAFLRNLNGAN